AERHRQRIDDEEHDPLDIIEGGWSSQRMYGGELLQCLKHAAQTQIVRQASIDEVDVGFVGILVRLEIACLRQDARCRPRRLLRIGKGGKKGRKSEMTGAAIVVD